MFIKPSQSGDSTRYLAFSYSIIMTDDIVSGCTKTHTLLFNTQQSTLLGIMFVYLKDQMNMLFVDRS